MPSRLVIEASAWLVIASLRIPVLARAADRESNGVAARAAYDAGARAYSDKRFVDAARRFEEAASLIPSSVALYTAALAWDRAGELAAAADDFAQAAALPGLSAQQATKANERLASLEKALGGVRIVGPANARVHLSDVEHLARVPATLHGAGGAHTVVAIMNGEGGGSAEQRAVVLEPGKTLELDFRPMTRADAPAIAPAVLVPSRPSDARPKRSSVRPAVGFALLGAGAAAELGAAALWSAAVGAGNDYRREPTEAAYDHAHGLESWTNVALVGGVVLAAAGVACLLWPAGHADSSSETHARAARRGEARGMSIALEVEPACIRVVGNW